MKKLLLLLLTLSIGMMGMAQIATLPKNMLTKAKKTELKQPVSDLSEFTMAVNPTVKAYQFLPEETNIGISWYDFFTNAFVGQHLNMFSDGTMAGTWTFGLQASDFPDRGTGYNYFDGNAWGSQPATRIESLRCGWGHISSWGPDGEFIVAHNGTDLTMNKRETKGSGDWTEMEYAGVAQPTWPKHAISGENNEYLHVVYHSYNEYGGMPGAMLYCRSTDGGATWDPQDEILDGTGPDYYYEIQAEAYYMAARGDIVAILVGGAWNDMFIMKSMDNGDTWEKIMVWEHPYPFFDFESTLTDTIFCTDNSGHLAIDADGMCHVVFGINRVLHDAVGTTYSYFPWVDGIGYWNEDMDPFSNDLSALAPPQYEYPTSEMVEDVNYIGYFQDVDGDGELTFITTSTGFPMSYRQLGPTSMPVIYVDDMGRRFVVFSSYTETYDNFEWNYHKIWARGYENGEWGPFFHVTQDIVHIFDESINPSIAQASDDDIYFLYQNDGTPGTAIDGDHDYQENRITVAALPKSDVLTGLDDDAIITNESVSQNYPNPFNQNSTVTVFLQESANLSLEVTNLAGQKVFAVERGRVGSGTHYFELNAKDFAPGVYFYSVKADNKKVTRKMIIN